MYTQDRETNPPSTYEKDQPLIHKCEICYEPVADKDLKIIKVPFLNIKKKLYVCEECETHHYLESE